VVDVLKSTASYSIPIPGQMEKSELIIKEKNTASLNLLRLPMKDQSIIFWMRSLDSRYMLMVV
jgi:hypothetical protein